MLSGPHRVGWFLIFAWAVVLAVSVVTIGITDALTPAAP